MLSVPNWRTPKSLSTSPAHPIAFAARVSTKKPEIESRGTEGEQERRESGRDGRGVQGHRSATRITVSEQELTAVVAAAASAVLPLTQTQTSTR